MTTIARRGAYLVCESQMGQRDYVISQQAKMYHEPGRFAVAFHGDSDVCREAIEWIKGGCIPHRVPDRGDWGAVILTPELECYWVSHRGYLLDLKNEYHAEGSGAAFAFGALAHGANPVQAVEAACKHDIYSGGPLSIYNAYKDEVQGPVIKLEEIQL